jgi:phosphatidylserine synthase
MGKLGWIPAFVYIAGAALRLARFNVQHRRRRQALLPGPAQPGGGGAGDGLIWVMDDAGFKGVTEDRLAGLDGLRVTLYAGLTMVTNAPFYSFKVFGGGARALSCSWPSRWHRAHQRWTRRGAVRAVLRCTACRATASMPGARSRASR